MELARRAGLNVSCVGLDTVLGRDVLLVNRFDRTDGGSRKMVVSALTILKLHDAAGIYHLTLEQATDIVDQQVAVIRDEWSSVCEMAELPTAERNRLWGRQFHNPFALNGH